MMMCIFTSWLAFHLVLSVTKVLYPPIFSIIILWINLRFLYNSSNDVLLSGSYPKTACLFSVQNQCEMTFLQQHFHSFILQINCFLWHENTKWPSDNGQVQFSGWGRWSKQIYHRRKIETWLATLFFPYDNSNYSQNTSLL